jgi:sugar-specific transcriptional regulator TrmB
MSTVARQDTYKVLNNLYRKGLVNKILSAPATFQAIPMQKAIDILLQNQEDEFDLTIEKTNQLLTKFENKKQGEYDEEPQFMVITGRRKIVMNGRERIEQAKESIDFASPWETFVLFILHQNESLERARQRNVTCRVIINKPEEQHIISKINVFLDSFPNTKLKYSMTPPFHVTIHDKKYSTFSVANDKANISEMNVLRSTNTSFINFTQYYFDKLWNELP